MLFAQDASGGVMDARVVEKGQLVPFFCPGCQEEVILRKGSVVVAHFAHKKGSDCGLFSEGETAEHLAGKELLVHFFPKARMEVYLPCLIQRPDVLLEDVAFEFQCSALSYTRFKERTSNYLRHRYRPVWLVGHRFSPSGSFTLFQKGCCQQNERLGVTLYELSTKDAQLLRHQEISWSFETGYSWKTYTRIVKGRWCFKQERRQYERNAEEYASWIQKQLMRQNPGLLSLQHEVYTYGYCLFELPNWCYKESMAGFYFTQDVLLFRVYFLLSPSFDQWLLRMNERIIEWQFPQVNQAAFLKQLYRECVELSEYSK